MDIIRWGEKTLTVPRVVDHWPTLSGLYSLVCSRYSNAERVWDRGSNWKMREKQGDGSRYSVGRRTPTQKSRKDSNRRDQQLFNIQNKLKRTLLVPNNLLRSLDF